MHYDESNKTPIDYIFTYTLRYISQSKWIDEYDQSQSVTIKNGRSIYITSINKVCFPYGASSMGQRKYINLVTPCLYMRKLDKRVENKMMTNPREGNEIEGNEMGKYSLHIWNETILSNNGAIWRNIYIYFITKF